MTFITKESRQFLEMNQHKSEEIDVPILDSPPKKESSASFLVPVLVVIIVIQCGAIFYIESQRQLLITTRNEKIQYAVLDSNTGLKIADGVTATIEKNPWQISLNRFLCGGTIIGDKWVLTAAHCTTGLSKDDLSIRAGSSYKFDGISAEIKQIIQHPKYVKGSFGYDFSLLELKKPLALGDGVGTIALAAANTQIEVDTKCRVTGWGNANNNTSTKKLQEMNIPVMKQQTCKQYFKAITDRMVCVGHPKGDENACYGDSGSPLSTSQNGKNTLVGVVPGGVCNVYRSGIFTRISHVRGWIKDNTGI